jgi:hypothetical protein
MEARSGADDAWAASVLHRLPQDRLLLAQVGNLFDETKNEWSWGSYTTHDSPAAGWAARLCEVANRALPARIRLHQQKFAPAPGRASAYHRTWA